MRSSNGIDSRVARILAKEPDVQQIRVDSQTRKIDVGFYSPPSQELFQQIETEVRQDFDGEWEISVQSEDHSPFFHRHHLNDHLAEFHRAHPPGEPRVIWKGIPLPAWRNRPFPPAVARDYRIMLLLVGICGLCTLTGFFAAAGWNRFSVRRSILRDRVRRGRMVCGAGRLARTKTAKD